ncbi:carbohydrate ABC transporter permease [Cohnella massiliensis]|uniref:carbohydrate ABC transporter permease n=1 Tax=Cohnella massiliensis TaxID=1816691 RepID=UPI001FE87D69|nr:sugar ABC transporter permease [Cohnella massiliensis]
MKSNVTTMANRPLSRPWTAAVLSAACAGGGQLLNRQYAKGALFLSFYAIGVAFILPRLYEAIRGLITLGDEPTRIVNGALVKGDHSIFMMIDGLIALFVAAGLVWLHVLNAVDAYRQAACKSAASGGRAPGVRLAAREGRTALLLLLPAFVLVLFVSVIPMLFNILTAFTDYSSPNHIPDRSLVNWIGWGTFVRLFTEPAWYSTFTGILLWNVVWAALSTLTVFFGGLLVALMINHPKVRFKKLWRTTFILPWAFPAFIAILVFRLLFNGALGPINGLLEQIGLPAVPWLADPTMAKVTILLVHFWISMPFLMALQSGILTTIPKDLYEAAEVDGAGGRAKFSRITMPHVLLATSPILIMQFASNFNNFNLIYMLTDGGPANPAYFFAGSTDILLSWIYKMTLEQNQFNMASAVSIVMFVLIASISVLNYSRTQSFKEKD